MLFTKLISSLRRRGVSTTFIMAFGTMLARAHIARAIKGSLDFIFDTRHGTRTAGIIALGSLRISSKRKSYGTHYVATPKYEFNKVIAHLDIDAKKYCFVDFGCGMGRVLLYAMDYKFSRVIGVEFSKYLADIARSNVSNWSRKYSGEVQIITGDAVEFVIPNEPCVLWFFNPFLETVTGEILSKIYHAYKSGNDQIIIIWYNVTPNAEPIFQAPWLEVLAGETACVTSKDKTPSLMRMAEISFPYSIFKVRAS
jgi:SAM-dependent methyltransferase